MQYLLSEEEMRDVSEARRRLQEMPDPVLLAVAVKNIACNAIGLRPDREWHAEREPSTRPHGCIHVHNEKGHRTAHYCDFCPVTKLCRLSKDWSK